jgi:hypothetical protein
MRKANTYTIDKMPPGVLRYPRIGAVVPVIKTGVSEKQRLGTTPEGLFCAQEVFMTTKRSSPLNNPLSEKKTTTTRFTCPYCRWSGNTQVMLERHISMYHESLVAGEGERARERGRVKDYGLPYWRCNKCNYRVGPASLSERYLPCQRWQDLMGTSKKCDGVMVPVD